MSLLANLKGNLSDREKILSWLSSIGETDPVCIEEVLKQCATDIEARRYFVWRYETSSDQ